MTERHAQEVPQDRGRPISRRELLRTLGAGGAILAVAPLWAACGSSPSSRPSPSSSSGGSPGSAGSTPPSSGANANVAQIADYIGPIDPKYSGKGIAYTFGAVLAFTGPGAFYGDVMSKGINLAAKHIKLLGGPDFTVSYKDHKSGDPTAGVTAVRELGAAKVPIMLASYNDDLGAMIPGSKQYQMLSLDGGGGTSVAFESKPYFWGMRANTPNDPFPGVFTYVKKKLGKVRRITLTGWDLGPSNVPIVNGMKRDLSAAGLEFGGYEPFAVGTTDYSTVIQRIKAGSPDLVYLYSYGLDPGYFMKQYVTSGVNKPVIGSEFTPDAAKVAGSAYDHYLFAYDYFDEAHPSSDWSKTFVTDWNAAYGTKPYLPDFYAANYYEDTFAVWELMRRVLQKGGDVHSGKDLQAALEANPTFHSIYGGSGTTVGALSLDLSTHAPSKRSMGLFDFNGGTIKPLALFDEAGANFQYLAMPSSLAS